MFLYCSETSFPWLDNVEVCVQVKVEVIGNLATADTIDNVLFLGAYDWVYANKTCRVEVRIKAVDLLEKSFLNRRLNEDHLRAALSSLRRA